MPSRGRQLRLSAHGGSAAIPANAPGRTCTARVHVGAADGEGGARETGATHGPDQAHPATEIHFNPRFDLSAPRRMRHRGPLECVFVGLLSRASLSLGQARSGRQTCQDASHQTRGRAPTGSVMLAPDGGASRCGIFLAADDGRVPARDLHRRTRPRGRQAEARGHHGPRRRLGVDRAGEWNRAWSPCTSRSMPTTRPFPASA
jgi:hypothetical protein